MSQLPRGESGDTVTDLLTVKVRLVYQSVGRAEKLIPSSVHCASVLAVQLSRGLQPASSTGHQLFFSGPWTLLRKILLFTADGSAKRFLCIFENNLLSSSSLLISIHAHGLAASSLLIGHDVERPEIWLLLLKSSIHRTWRKILSQMC